jgi:hypothetical protein
MKKKSQAEVIEILLKNIINMHEKLNIINERLALDEDFKDVVRRDFVPEEDKLVEIDKSTYEQMCDLMDSNVIPFMGIA